MTKTKKRSAAMESDEGEGNGNGGTLLRFRLKRNVGPHFEPNPEFDSESPETEDNLRELMFEAGDVVKSNRNLARLFENKFIPYDEMTKRKYKADMEEEKDDEEENEKEKALNMKYSEEVEEEGDDDLEAERTFLKSDNLTPAQRVKKKKQREEAVADEGDPDEEDETPKAKKSRKLKEKLEAEGLGEDVSEDFPKAADAGMSVFKNGSRYYVADNDNPTKPLTSRKGVKRVEASKFLRKQLK